MSFLHLSLLTGGSFVAVPVLLHLLMRRRPKHQVFPAIRFVRELRRTNQQRLLLKNWLLLMLRCALVLGLALALARPSVASNGLAGWTMLGGLGFLAAVAGLAALVGFRGGIGRWLTISLGLVALLLGVTAVALFLRIGTADKRSLVTQVEAPVAAALIFDTSPRMGLQFENQSRLAKAKELGKSIMAELPEDSEIAVVDNALGTAVFSIDRRAAQKSIQALSEHPVTQPFAYPLNSALDLLTTNSRTTKEIYLFTDLTARAWSGSPDVNLAQRISDSGIRVYVLDVGVEDPQNVDVGTPQLNGEVVARGSRLTIECELRNEGRPRQVTAEFLVEKPDPRLPMIVDGEPKLPELQLRHEQTVELTEDGSARIEFSLPMLSAGSHHGQVRLRGTDGLEIDNIRFFTIQATDQWPVLLAAGPGADSEDVLNVLSPLGDDQTGQASYRCDVVSVDELRTARLTAYSAVALLDPPPLSDGVWKRLSQFVDRGGGLAIFLGRNAGSAKAFNSTAALELMPSRIVRQSRASGNGLTMRFSHEPHPILNAMRPDEASINWANYSIKRHWAIEQVKETGVIVRFGNGQPAIVERQVGMGHIVVWTTPVSDPAGDAARRRPPWNRLATGLEPWPFFGLVWETFEYIVQQGGSRLNYEVGQPVSLLVRDATGKGQYQMFDPSGVWQPVTASRNRVTLPMATTPGTYRLRPASGRGTHWGFSMNLPTRATDLHRMDRAGLDQWLGKEGYRLARDRESVDREVGEARIGHELYPWLMVFVALVLMLEHLLANRFYHRSGLSNGPGSTATLRDAPSTDGDSQPTTSGRSSEVASV